MPYTSNPYAPKARRLAVNDVLSGRLTQAQTARKYGVVESTISKWMRRAPRHNNQMIDTLPSRPKYHPNQLPLATVSRIVQLRKRLKRCAPIIHAHLQQEGIVVSLSSVKRTLRRHNLTRKKKPAKWYTPLPRPVSDKPGALVQMDTIHYVRPDGTRFYLYVVIDTYSRLGYAEYHTTLSQRISYKVVMRAQKYFGFPFLLVQTDNGPEFKSWLQFTLGGSLIYLRHSRVRKPNDNAHVERFNRTIQEECFSGFQPDEKTVEKQLATYIVFYNTERLHLSLNCQTPTDFLSKVLN